MIVEKKKSTLLFQDRVRTIKETHSNTRVLLNEISITNLLKIKTNNLVSDQTSNNARPLSRFSTHTITLRIGSPTASSSHNQELSFCGVVIETPAFSSSSPGYQVKAQTYLYPQNPESINF